MKIKTTVLLAGIFAMATATAQPLTTNEIFSSIDGEYDHALEDSMSTTRVNFSITSFQSNEPGSMDDDALSWVLSGVDGEYQQ